MAESGFGQNLGHKPTKPPSSDDTGAGEEGFVGGGMVPGRRIELSHVQACTVAPPSGSPPVAVVPARKPTHTNTA